MNTHFLPFHRAEIGEEEIRSVGDTLRSGWLTSGPRTTEFEQAFARFVGARHALAVNSCTAGLHLSLEAVGVQNEDEVIIPTMTFAATAEVVVHLRAKPVLVDCEENTLNIDPRQIESAITPKTKAIVPVHFAGQPCAMEHILEIARKHHLIVIEDAAHALPALYQGTHVGHIGDITCFSFYATKTLTTGEGGMIVTDNGEYADRMRIMSLHGISRSAWNRYAAEGSWYYEILAPGFKYNLSDIASAIGIEQLKKCERFWQARCRIATLYHNGFADIPEVITPVIHASGSHAWHLYVIQLVTERLKIGRNEFIEHMKAAGIGTSVHFIPLHLHPYYRDVHEYRSATFPVATAAFHRIVSLPIYPAMQDADVERVITAVSRIIKENCK